MGRSTPPGRTWHSPQGSRTRSGVGISRLEIRSTPSCRRTAMGSSSTQDQHSRIRARGLVSRAPRAKALMAAGTPKMGLEAT